MKIDDLQLVKAAALHRFGAIKAKYVKLKGWLVFSSRLGQTDLDSDAAKMVTEFPEMFVNDDCMREATRVITEVARLEKEARASGGSTSRHVRNVGKGKPQSVDPSSDVKFALNQLRSHFTTLAGHLEVLPDVQVEIRFHDLNYEDVIKPLLEDPIIDRDRSPKGGIRIVIGTVGDLLPPNR